MPYVKSTRPSISEFPKRKDFEDAKDWEIACLKFHIKCLNADLKDRGEEYRQLGRQYNGFLNRAYDAFADRGIRVGVI